MEINRHFKSSFTAQAEASNVARNDRTSPAKSTSASRVSAEPSLEPLQDALRSLPDVDLDKVAAIKAALQRGEISSDADSLAGSMLAYHSGSDT
ncbi:flagellar biosynthesis anti-sigma factor FlgM [Pseudomonas indica]|uniref:flagellar biosynthesis anti-sigma factor FlgM n=1 Tax=Pseudomonas indica TaxID=137658 RepID=UPI000BAB26E4|nr:flagellar biosynthesis anti-sigma factor FlgM [Pseudomonas indica]PAU60112.1 flagellar biosynthesis anti-sigma factor FlgM [Pseudomonas indica]